MSKEGRMTERSEPERGGAGRLVTIADAGHMLHHDQPAAVAAAMEAFVAEI